ncbi:hypothetical protein HMSSN036_40940 [Paenibacillus macerans]|nr:hypothetical protein HMSSN036_40940 [Paenibacillus macerans]
MKNTYKVMSSAALASALLLGSAWGAGGSGRADGGSDFSGEKRRDAECGQGQSSKRDPAGHYAGDLPSNL